MTQQYTDISLDIETLGKSARSPILSIGAVAFNIEEYMTLGPDFYKIIDLKYTLPERRVDKDTLLWWMNQSAGARKVFDAGYPPAYALGTLTEFIRSHPTYERIWANGTSFDFGILGDYYMEIMHTDAAPWDFRKERDLRTLKDYSKRVAPPYVNTNVDYGILHNAVDDAKAQALTIQNCHRTLIPLKT